jgi:hypothetical protein
MTDPSRFAKADYTNYALWANFLLPMFVCGEGCKGRAVSAQGRAGAVRPSKMGTARRIAARPHIG